jgi:hypothetical protein
MPGPQQTPGIVLLLSLVACATPGAPTDIPAPSRSAPGIGAQNCATIDLRSPSGNEIDLTGTWMTEKEGVRGGLYHFQQSGECIWFAGAIDPGVEVGDIALDLPVVVFAGRMGTDLTVAGRWADTPNPNARGIFGRLWWGDMTLKIEFIGPGADEQIRLVFVGGTGAPFLEPGYREDQSWVRISDP